MSNVIFPNPTLLTKCIIFSLSFALMAIPIPMGKMLFCILLLIKQISKKELIYKRVKSSNFQLSHYSHQTMNIVYYIPL